MKKIIISIMLFFSITLITNAIPLPGLALGYDFILFLIPGIIAIFSIVYFYFRKYLFWFILTIFIFIIILYEIHFLITKTMYFYRYELLGLLLIGVLVFFSKKVKLLRYLVILPLFFIMIVLIKVDYNLYEFYKIYGKMKNTELGKKEITKVMYKDNFIVVYGLKNINGFYPYTVVEVGALYDDKYYLRKGDYYIVYGPYGNLGKNLSDLAYEVIDN